MHKQITKIVFLVLLILLTSCVSSKERVGPKISNIAVTPKNLTTDATVDIKFVIDVSESPSLDRIDVVLIDLSNLGGSTEQNLVDDGTNGDDVANDNLYTFVLVGYTTPSTKQILSINVTARDLNSREAIDIIEIQVVAHPKIVAFDVSNNPAKPGETVTFTATVNQGEYPISAVEVDLTNIGGSANETMSLNGATWTVDYKIPDSGNPSLPAGDYKITLVASDNQNPPFQSTKTLDLTLSAIKPSLSASSPKQTIASGDTLFEFTIKAPNGYSNFTNISADFSDIGGSATQPIYDDGTNGDITANDGIYSFLFPANSWISTLIAKNLYFEIDIKIEQSSGNTVYLWAPLFIYSGKIIHVDGTYGDDTTGDGSDVKPWQTIQKGIDDATDGDLVLVNTGTYTGTGNRDLVFSGKKIIVKSKTGAVTTTINAGGISNPDHRIATFTNYEVRETMIAGFTLTGGYVTSLSHGGVFDVLNSCPRIISCIIKDNYAKERGGIMNVRLTITNYTTDPWLHRCYCENNNAGRSGGAIYSYNETATTLTNCVFKNTTVNAVSSENVNGGAVYSYDASTYIENCVFENNLLKNTKSTYSARGGAVYIKSDKNKPDYYTKIINSIFINNTADSTGGNGEGGAIYLYSSNTKVEIRNCTFAENQAKSGGTDEARGGAICSSNSQSNMFDSILWGNSVSGSAAVGNEIQHYSSSSYNNLFNMVNCCIRNQANDIVEVSSGTLVQTNVIYDNPKFVTGLNGDYYLEQVASGGNADSPCINAGSDTSANLNLDSKTTQTDGKVDENAVNMGYHYDS